jgi:hypothetical protein
MHCLLSLLCQSIWEKYSSINSIALIITAVISYFATNYAAITPICCSTNYGIVAIISSITITVAAINSSATIVIIIIVKVAIE